VFFMIYISIVVAIEIIIESIQFSKSLFLLSSELKMSAGNPFNVYRGPDSLRDYYDPDQQPMIPLVEIPRKLNPFYEDGVKIYAKMMSTLPANNVKALPGTDTFPIL